MAWNEPGNGGDNKDPWGSGGRRGNNDGPPDIDEVIRNLSKKLNGIFGSSGGSGSSSGGGSPGKGFSAGLAGGLALTLFVIWAFMGFYVVDEAERGVVLRFGRVMDQVVMPGLHWNPPVIDEVTVVNIQQINTRPYRNDMLTTDENILNVQVAVQYRIQDPVKFVIAVQDPVRSLDNASESAIRHVVGGNYMDQLLTTGRDAMATEVRARLQEYMDTYSTGILISQVNVVDAQPPDAVRPAFDDVIRAREDEQRAQNQAQQYANQIIPEARGEAQRTIEQANAYRSEVIARAQGDASRFDQLLAEYSKAPEVTRQRLYIDSLQDVMTNSSKIMIDVEGGNNMLYVPLDKIMEQNANVNRTPTNAAQLRQLADQLAPFLPSNNSGTVNSSRLNTTAPRGR